MRLYHAGSRTHDLAPYGLERPLLAFSERGNHAFRYWLEENPRPASVFMDCGAYAAYMHGRTVDLGEYCDFLHTHAGTLAAYAALDVIGDWRASAVNLDAMLARGLRPVPVFHRGSPLSELQRLARDHGAVAIGGMMSHQGQKMHRQTPEYLAPFLDSCFDALRKHWPVRVHLFGTATQWVLERYPASSSDSATVVLGASLGTYAQWEQGSVRWKYWWEEVPRTYAGELGDLAGRDKAAARLSRYVESWRSMQALERHVTDLWAARGFVL